MFRWRIVGEAADVSLSARERGALVRALAPREHLGPDGRWVRVSRNTLDHWMRACREGGLEALVPAPRRVANRTPERLLELAIALRREQPARTAAQIHRIIVESEGGAPTACTIQRHLAAAGLLWDQFDGLCGREVAGCGQAGALIAPNARADDDASVSPRRSSTGKITDSAPASYAPRAPPPARTSPTPASHTSAARPST